MNRYLIGLCVTAMITGLPGAHLARAADLTGNPPSEAVRIDGSDLTSSAGIVRVHERLEGAARDVCRAFDIDEKDLGRQVRFRRCVADALERAVQEVHDARLSAYHQRTGAPRTVAMVAGAQAAAR